MSNTLNYTQYDFDQLVLQLQERLKNKATWQDIYRSSTGEMLIELFCYVLNLGMFYTERRAGESYILTAKNRSSIINLVALLNYNPKRKSSSVGSLTFSVVPLTKIVYIPKYTECQSVDGIKFLTNEDAAIEKGHLSISVQSIQGELTRIEISSNGSTNQKYPIKDTSVENSASISNPTFRVIIDGIEWTKVDSFIYSLNTSKHFRVINEIDGTVSVQFGDNINGVIPQVGSKIAIQYIKSAGLSGNVIYTTPKITEINSTIYDEDGVIVSGITVENTASFLGGDNEEDTEEIRYEAPRVFKTGQRAVTKDDFIAILENYPGVANVNVWGENEEAIAAGVSSLIAMRGIAKICIILQDWSTADASFQQILSEYLYNGFAELTVRYQFITPVILYVVPVFDIKVATGYSMSQTQADIDSVVADQFKLGTTTKLGIIVKYSNVISAVNDLDSVAYCNMILEIKKDLSIDSYFNYYTTLEALDIKPGTVRLFVDGEYVVTDVDNGDGTGSFSSAGGYTISGAVNYSTGTVTLDISPTPSTDIYVRYQQSDNGNILPTLEQICKLDSVDIQSIVMES